ncbi:MAG: PAS domain S-box protein [Desulfobacterales bacterium]|nr:PAS domain S-box protein [Desulfobacterales bacterium]
MVNFSTSTPVAPQTRKTDPDGKSSRPNPQAGHLKKNPERLMDESIPHLERTLKTVLAASPNHLDVLIGNPASGILFSPQTKAVSAPDSAPEIDPDIEWISPGFWHLLGQDPLAHPHTQAAWQAYIYPPDRPLAAADLTHPGTTLIRFQADSNRIIPLFFTVRTVEAGDPPCTYRLIFVTEAQGSVKAATDTRQEKAVDLPEDLEQAVFYMDTDNRILRMNPAAELLSGYMESEAKSKDIASVLTLIDGNTGARVTLPENVHLHGNQAKFQDLDILAVSRSQARMPVSIHCSQILDDRGKPNGIVLVLKPAEQYDISKRLIDARLSLIEYAAANSLDDLLKKALDNLGKLVDSPIGFYHFVEPDQKSLTLQQWSTRTLDEFCNISGGKGLHYDIDRAGVWVECVHAKKPVIHNDYESLPNKRGLPKDHAPLIRELVVPVIRKDRVVAILGVGNKPSDYTASDTEIVSYFADITWEIVHQKRLEEEVKLQKRIEEELADLSALLLTQTSLEAISEQVLKTAKRLTRSRYGYVGTYDDQTASLTCHTMTRDVWKDCRIPDKSIVFEKCTGLFGWVLEHRKPLMLNQVADEKRACGTPEGHIPIEAYLGVPALIGGRLVGQISLANPDHRFLDIDLKIATRLADLFALAVQRQQYHTHLLEIEAKKAEDLEKTVRQRTREVDASRRLLENIFKSQLDGILVTDADSPPRITDCNPAAERIFGRSRQQIIGRSTDFLHDSPGQDHIFWDRLNACAATDRHIYQEAGQVRQAGGTFLPVRINATQMRTPDTDNTCIGWVLVFQDDREQQHYQETLRKNQEKFRAIADYTVDWESWLDPTGELLWINPAVETITGYTMAEFSGGDTIYDTLGRIVMPDTLHQANQLLSEVLEKRQSINDIHFQLRKKDGTHCWVSFSCRPIYSETGQYLGIRTSIRDITGTKEAEKKIARSEQRLALVLDTLRDGVWDWRLDNGEVYFSPRYYTMLGYEPGELPAAYDTWRTLTHPEDLPSAEQTISEALQSATPFEMEFRMKAKDGGWRWILGRGRTVEKDDHGKSLRMLGTHMDITHRKEMDNRMRQSQKLEAVGTLAGGIAHDFNNILAGIIGYAELVMDEVDPASKGYGRLKGIISGSERARELISQILTFSRKTEREQHPVDIRLIVKEAMTLLRASLPATIRIEQYIAPALPFVMGDPTQIHQVIMNLCTNALHAMAEGGILTVTLTMAEPDNGRLTTQPDRENPEGVLLQVSDTGCGIPSDVLPKIFDPFFTTKDKERGTGLGLSVVHGIIRDHNGDIRFESQEGQGTDVIVYFPAHEHSGQDKQPDTSPHSAGTERILLVDDEEVLSVVVQDMLENMGYRVTALTDSLDALQRFSHSPEDWDILLTDVTMPHMTGYELAQAVLRVRPELPVIMWSGDHSNLPRELDDTTHRITFLKKPFRQPELAQALRDRLDS